MKAMMIVRVVMGGLKKKLPVLSCLHFAMYITDLCDCDISSVTTVLLLLLIHAHCSSLELI